MLDKNSTALSNKQHFFLVKPGKRANLELYLSMLKKKREALVRMQKMSGTLDAMMCHKILGGIKNSIFSNQQKSPRVPLNHGKKKKIIDNWTKCVCVSVQILSLKKVVETKVTGCK